MKISKKCQYALKAIFELASRNPGEPVKIQNVAEAQGISHCFLEAVLFDIKNGVAPE